MGFELVQTGLDILGVIIIYHLGNMFFWSLMGRRLKLSIEKRTPVTKVLFDNK